MNMNNQLEHAINEFKIQLLNNKKWYDEYMEALKLFSKTNHNITALEMYNIIRNKFYWEIQKSSIMNILVAYNGDITKIDGFDDIQMYIDDDIEEIKAEAAEEVQ